MNTKRLRKKSKFLSLVLRHQPDLIGIHLDSQGWTPIVDLLAGCKKYGKVITIKELQYIVDNNDKQRFAFSPDGHLIRASQGHSVAVDLGYEAKSPPSILFHGTSKRFLPAIWHEGLIKGSRHHVHLSSSAETATSVGQRHGSPVVLTIDAQRMVQDGFVFFFTPNEVWLTEHVPPVYLSFLSNIRSLPSS